MKNGLVKTLDAEETAFDAVLAINDAYRPETAYFVRYCKESQLSMMDALAPYVESLADGWKDSAGRKHRYSAAAYNKRLNAAKNRIRFLLRRSTTLTLEERRAVDEILTKEYKAQKLGSTEPDKDKFLELAEVKKLLADCSNRRIMLIIRFLVTTGCRISEALNLLNTDIHGKGKFCDIHILGKGNKERRPVQLQSHIEEIREEFGHGDYLFEHGGRRYNRQSITRRISDEARRILGKDISAHALRHSYATLKRDEGKPVEVVSRLLGHASVSTTVNFYYNRKITSEDALLDLSDVGQVVDAAPVLVDEETALLDKLDEELRPDELVNQLRGRKSVTRS